MEDYQKKLENFLELTIKEGASDLHLSCNRYPSLRIVGMLIALTREKKLSPEDIQGLAKALIPKEAYRKFLEEKEVDFSYNFKDKARFRANVFLQRGGIAISLRLIPSRIRTIEELNLPPFLHRFTKAPQGLVLITGPSSHGKSTTLAALIDEINHTRTDHVVTIEDPIEYLFEDDKSIIDQREVYQDTLSFSRALKSVFRQDPDVIMVGEMRDSETIATTITAAETGHLVFATLHTNSASQTIHRIVDSFDSTKQSQITAQLSGSLLGVVSQRLIPGVDGNFIPACEIMVATSATTNLIRENKIHELPLVIETSGKDGMISLNRSLAVLVIEKKITMESALSHSLHPNELKMMVK